MNEDALSVIRSCDNWYRNKEVENFHRRKNLNGREIHLHRTNFAKRGCADDANLCEVVSVAPEKESAAQEFIDSFLSANRFAVQYRKQLEKTSAMGTTGAYLYLKNATMLRYPDGTLKAAGGDIRLNYCDADCIIPLTVENDLVTECAFSACGKVKGKEKTTLVIFTLEDGLYRADTVVFDKGGRKEEENSIQLGEVKPFSLLANAEVNNLENMEGYGYPKIYGATHILKALDLCSSILYGDLDKGEKLVFLNELLAEVKTREDGSLMLTPQQKDLFILLGERLPQEKTLIHEYNPQIRVEEITKVFELLLSMFSMVFGYGTKKYTFEESGQVKTATECIIDNQQAMQELNRQRKNAEAYITDILRAAMWFSNQFHGTSYDLQEPLSIEFDDSIITDRQSQLEAMRADALSFPEIPELLAWYISEKYNLPVEEARKLAGKEEEAEEDQEE